MASPNTIRRNAEIEARAAEVRKRVQDEVAQSHPSKPRTSIRWMGRRTKGLPFSKTSLVGVKPSPGPGRPAMLTIAHPTRGGRKVKPATPGLLAVFFPALPDNLRASMLGF